MQYNFEGFSIEVDDTVIKTEYAQWDIINTITVTLDGSVPGIQELGDVELVFLGDAAPYADLLDKEIDWSVTDGVTTFKFGLIAREALDFGDLSDLPVGFRIQYSLDSINYVYTEPTSFDVDITETGEPAPTELPTEFVGSEGVEWSFSTVDIAEDAREEVVATLTLKYPDTWYDGDGADSFVIGFGDSRLADGSPINGNGLFKLVPTGFDPDAKTVTYEIVLLQPVAGSDLLQDFVLGLRLIGYDLNGENQFTDVVDVQMDLGGDGFVVPDNTAPTDIEISRDTVAFNAAAGTVVGAFSTTDAEGGPITYTLEDDVGGRFTLVTENGVTSLVVNAALGGQVGSQYFLTVRATDSDGAWTVEQINIRATAANANPANLALSADTIAENSAHGTVVGELSATDADGDSLTYTLTDDAGGKFSLVVENGITRLVVNGTLDYEAATSHDVTVKVSDGNGGETTQTFTVDVTDVDEGSSGTTITTPNGFTISIDDDSFDKQVSSGETLATITVGYPNGLDYFELSPPGNGIDLGADFGLRYEGTTYNSVSALVEAIDFASKPVSISFQIVALRNFDFGNIDSHDLTFVFYADDWATFESDLVLPISVETDGSGGNTAPSDLALSAGSVAENAALGAVVGTLSANDADNDTLTYTLTDDADGKFSLVTQGGVTRLVVNGALDFETATSHEVSVKVSDGHGGETTRTFTVNVTDVNETPGSDLPPTDLELNLFRPVSEEFRPGYVIGALSATDPEGGEITWSLPTRHTGSNLTQQQLDENNTLNDFMLREQPDGSMGLVIRLTGGLDYESGTYDGHYGGGRYAAVVIATDEAGNQTKHTFFVQSQDEHVKFTAAPTGKTYAGIIENASEGTEVGYLGSYDGSFVPTSVTLTDDAGGRFAIETRVVGGETRYYVVVNGELDYETAQSHFITIRATNSAGVSHDKVIEMKVVDAVDTGDAPRGTITIDADTALAATNGGVDWDNYLDAAYAPVNGGLPGNIGLDPNVKLTELQYSLAGGKQILLGGSNLAYYWADPVSGEDVHVLAGTVNSLTFGNSAAAVTSGWITNPELKITGLDLTNDSGVMNRIYGEANIIAATWMHGPDSSTPSEIEHVKAILASYAQNFIGSGGADTYTGTMFNDTITGKGGGDTLDGGGGQDVAIFSGNFGDYTFAQGTGGSVVVIDGRANADDSDTIVNIEQLQFRDRTVAVEDVLDGDAPELDITLAGGQDVRENAALGTVVGTLSTDGADGAVTYSLTGSAAGKFTIVGNELRVNGPIDFETNPTLAITVVATDAEDNSVAEAFTIDVENVDEAPVDLALSGNVVGENAAVGTVVGRLSATDPEGQAITYTLSNDAGGTFEIVGNQIRVKAPLDFETAASHSISVLATDPGGNTAQQSFQIGVVDESEGNQPDMITIDASGSNGMDLEAYIRGGFVADTVGGGMPVFDHGAAFAGEEMVVGYGSDATSKYVLAHGELEYFFGSHTVHGTINTIEYGTVGSGTYDANGYFSGGNVQLRLTGLDLFNGLTPETEVEENGPVHNFAVAHMYGAAADPTRLNRYADALDAYAQHFIGSRGNDIYVGTAFDDLIAGKGGNDAIDGGAGIDTVELEGSLSDYMLTGATLTAVAGTPGAYAVIGASGSWTATSGDGTVTLQGVERIRFAAPDDDGGIDDPDDDPDGGTGGDPVGGTRGDDKLVGSAGDDTIRAGAGNDIVRAGGGNDTVHGGSGADRLFGEGGSDTLIGGKGSDVLVGGAGKDLLLGGSGSDVLKGGDGNDLLSGGIGRDTLSGGRGHDTFLFDTKPGKGVSDIVNFRIKDDIIALDRGVFKAIGDRLDDGEFVIGRHAADEDDHIIYNSDKGRLFYDADGSGNKDAVVFATIDKDLKLTADHFLMV